MINNNFDIIFFGDSLTFGYGVHKTDCFAYKLAKEMNFTYLNQAKNGDTSSAMLTRYSNDVIKYSPKRLFIMCGTNDLLCKRSVNSIIENIEIMIKDALEIKSEIIIGIPPTFISEMANELFSPSSFYEYAEYHLEILKGELIKLCNKYKIKYINFFDLPLNNKTLFIDGLHLTPKGHDIMFNEAFKVFKNYN